jgi:hypothetical protein
MIPHRMPNRTINNEISGVELRNRVTACRKRLRENRVMFKAQANAGIEELFPEARPSLMECPVRATAAVQADRSFSEPAEQTEELEVGIT